jgi:S-adenosylmethionine synthetase
MGVRHGDRLDLTIASAMIDRFLQDLDEYGQSKAAVAEIARTVAARHTGKPVQVVINAADAVNAESVYQTVTGTSGEAGDDGQAGRGNRVNGVRSRCGYSLCNGSDRTG